MREYNLPIEIRDMRNGDWYWVSKSVLYSKKINSSAKIVYSALSTFTNKDSQSAYPSVQRIAELLNINRDTVMQSIKSLENTDYIKVERSVGRPNIYILLKVVGNSDQLETHRKFRHHPSEIPTPPIGNSDPNYIKEQKVKNKDSNRKKSLEFIKTQFKELQKKYPDLDIEEEYETAKDWLLSKDKRFKNYPAFFRNWLRKAHKLKKEKNGAGIASI